MSIAIFPRATCTERTGYISNIIIQLVQLFAFIKASPPSYFLVLKNFVLLYTTLQVGSKPLLSVANCRAFVWMCKIMGSINRDATTDYSFTKGDQRETEFYFFFQQEIKGNSQ